MNSFQINGYLWHVYKVPWSSPLLVDRTGRRTVATTDPSTKSIYISTNISGDFGKRVLLHELGHCVIYSFNLEQDIYRMVRPESWIEAEEWMCNLIADYGEMIFKIAYQILENNLLQLIA